MSDAGPTTQTRRDSDDENASERRATQADPRPLLVIGGAGLVGAPIVRAMAAAGHRVRVMSRSTTAFAFADADAWAKAERSAVASLSVSRDVEIEG